MKNLKRTIPYLLVVLLVAVISIVGTLAYMTDTKEADNKVTIGEVDILLLDGDKTQSITPGNSVAQGPKVKNLEEEAFIKAEVVISGGSFGNIQQVNDFIKITSGTGWDWSEWATTGVIYLDNALEKPVGAGEVVSPPMFTNVELKASVPGQEFPVLEEAAKGFEIQIKVSAIQSTLNGVKFTTAKEAFDTMLGPTP